MIPIGFHPEARAEFLEAARYYHQQKPGLGLQYISAIETLLGRIGTNPLRFHPIEENIRQARVLRFPYGVIYRVRLKDIQIIAVTHLKREPNYWRDRL